MRVVAAFALLAAFAAQPAAAHPLQFGVLRATELGSDRVRLDLTFSGSEANPRAASLPVPDGCNRTEPAQRRELSRGVHLSLELECEGGLAGRQLRVVGLGDRGATQSQVRAIVTFEDGVSVTHTLDAGDPSFIVGAGTGPSGLSDSLVLGVLHVLSGVDHLAFLLGLIGLVVLFRDGQARWRKLFVAVTAFTIGHSVTLALAVFGALSLPAAPVEALIAASVVFLALALVRAPGHGNVIAERPEVAAFAFGLLHGLGFAGVLLDASVPAAQLPVVLLGFNLGVEVGQLLFVVVAVAILVVLRRGRLRQHLGRGAGYVLGAAGVFLFLSRMVVIMQ